MIKFCGQHKEGDLVWCAEFKHCNCNQQKGPHSRAVVFVGVILNTHDGTSVLWNDKVEYQYIKGMTAEEIYETKEEMEVAIMTKKSHIDYYCENK